MILPFRLRRLCHVNVGSIQHILNKNPIPRRRIVYHYVCDGSDQLTVLDNRAARHECGQ